MPTHIAPLFRDLVVLLTASLPLVFLCRRVGLPALCGFLVTGVIIGPSATGLIQSLDRVSVLAEVGVVLLLFTIGLEFSLERLLRMSRTLVGVGSLQVIITAALVFIGAVSWGYDVRAAVVFAFIVSLSSTAVTLTILQGRAELSAPHGRLTLAVLLFQDLCVLPMMLVLPALAVSDEISRVDIASRMALAVGVIGLVVYVARKLLPGLLSRVLKLRSRELFIGTVVVACFGTAWLTAELGLSLAIGAFLAGLVVSESEYSHQIVAEVLPLRDLFSSVFFVSIGMLLDVSFLGERGMMVAGLAAAVLVIKVVAGTAAVLPFRASPHVALMVGFSLAQVGEFSFVLAKQAQLLDIISASEFQLVLSVSVITMLVTPLLSTAASTLAAGDLPGLEPDVRLRAERAPHGHVVVVGYGAHGRSLCRVLRESGIPYSIIDLDPEAVEAGRQAGESILYGDATREVVLGHVHAESANAIVVTISYPAASRRIVALARGLNARAAVVVRTRYVSEIEDLYHLGATEVIPEEFETSVEMFARVLQCLDVPQNVIAAQVDVVRSEHYALLSDRGAGSKPHLEGIYELFAAATTVTHLIRKGSPAISVSLGKLAMAATTGATIIAAVRKGQATTDPADEFVLERGDILVLMGSHAQLAAARACLEPVAK